MKHLKIKGWEFYNSIGRKGLVVEEAPEPESDEPKIVKRSSVFLKNLRFKDKFKAHPNDPHTYEMQFLCVQGSYEVINLTTCEFEKIHANTIVYPCD